MSRFTILLAALSFLHTSGLAQEKETPDPYEWIIETYQFPVDDLGGGFASPERGALVAPTLPGDNATDEEVENFVRKSSSVVSHYLELKGLSLPKGSLVVFDPESLTLAARLPRIAQSSVAFTVEAFQEYIEKYIAVEHSIYEAPGEMMRRIIDRAGESYDHTPLLEELEKATEGGNAIELSRARVDTRSGNRSKITAKNSVAKPEEVWIDSSEQIGYISAITDYEKGIEVDTVLGSDNETIDLNTTINHHYASRLRRKGIFTQRGKTIISNSVTDTFDATITSQYTTKDGAVKMLGVWKPAGLEGERNKDVLQASFVRTDVVRVLPLINPRLSEMLEKHGEKVEPIPDGKLEFEKVAEEVPEGMIVRRYTIPPTFLSGGASGGGGGATADPFAAMPSNEPRFTVRVTAKDILENAGISFPAGSSANYIRETSTLVVRNLPEQIQLVEAYIMSLRGGTSKSIAITMHILEGPAKTMKDAVRKTRRIADHSLVWGELREQENVSILTSSWIEARSGNRAKVESGRNYHYPVESSIDTIIEKEKKDDEKEELAKAAAAEVTGLFDVERIGTVFEVDPVLGADNKTIDLNFVVSHDYAPPGVTNQTELTPEAINLDGPTTEFHEGSVTTQIILRSGMFRLAGVWQPEGTPEYDKGETLHAVFIKAEVVELKDEDDEIRIFRPVR